MLAAAQTAQAASYAAAQNGIQAAYAQLQAALTATYNTKVLNYMSERTLQETNLQAQLTALGAALQLHPGLWQATHDKIMAMFKTSFGPAYTTAGRNLGEGFADGLQQSTPAVTSAATKLANKVAAILKLHSPAKEGPLRP